MLPQTVGEEVWRDAIVRGPEGSSKYRNNVFDRLVLPYSTFNGVYKKEESRHSEGRPIYVEQKKYDRTPFDEVTPTYDPYSGIEHDIDRIVPAVIKYCGGRWVFSHEYIYSSAKKDKVIFINIIHALFILVFIVNSWKSFHINR